MRKTPANRQGLSCSASPAPTCTCGALETWPDHHTAPLWPNAWLAPPPAPLSTQLNPAVFHRRLHCLFCTLPFPPLSCTTENKGAPYFPLLLGLVSVFACYSCESQHISNSYLCTNQDNWGHEIIMSSWDVRCKKHCCKVDSNLLKIKIYSKQIYLQ